MDKRSSLGPVTLKGRYRIETVLGQGGFSMTYKGMDLKEQAPVAIKEYYPGGLAVRDASVSPEVRCVGDRDFFVKNKERFLREAAVLAQFPDHERVVRIIDHFEENNTAYIVMEYVSGMTLGEHVRKAGGKITWKETAPILNALIETLIPFHEQGIIHRDISPENIMMLPDGGIKLLDFGAVKQVGENAEVGRMLTKPTEAIVKQGYAPIEQYQNRGNLGPWTDVYALCATACYCLTGSVPPDAPARIVTSASVGLIERGVDISEKEEAAIQKGMEILAQDRIQSMEALQEALFGGGKRTAFFSRVRRRVLLAAAVVIFFTCVIVSGAIAQGRESRYVLQEGDSLEAYLQRSRIKEIVIPDGMSYTLAEAAVGKRITVEEGASLCVGNLIVADDGYIEVEGTLDMENAILHTLGTGQRVKIAGDGELLTNANTLIWMEREENLEMAENGGIAGGFEGYKLILDEEELFSEAVSVTGLEELKTAAQGTRPIRIDADIEIEESLHFQAAVLVSEGVTLTHGVHDWLTVGESAVFVNRGTVKGGLSSNGPAYFINYGNMDMRDEQSVSLWIQGESVFINQGMLNACDSSRFWADTVTYNLGMLNAYSFFVLGGDLINTGEIYVRSVPDGEMSGNDGFILANGSVLYNRGSLVMMPGTKTENYGCIENTGTMLVKDQAVFYNSILHNQGYFESTDGAGLQDVSGIYYGEGEFCMPWNAGISVFTMKEETVGEDAAEVYTQEEFAAALARDDISQILIRGEIRLSENLTVEKELFVEGTLVMEQGAFLTVRAARVILLYGGRMTAGKVRLLHDAQMIVNRGAKLSVEENGELQMDERALLLGEGGEIFLEQASLTVENNACVLLLGAKCHADQANVNIADGAVLVTVPRDGWNGQKQQITVGNDAEWHCLGNTSLQEAEILVEGILINSAEKLTLSGGTVVVKGEGRLYHKYCLLGMTDTTIENDGTVQAYGWEENKLTLKRTDVRNTGELALCAWIEMDERTEIENEGTCYLWTPNREQIRSHITGEEPVQ